MTLDKHGRIFVYKFYIDDFLATEDETQDHFDIKYGLLGIMRDRSFLLIVEMYWRDLDMIRNVSIIIVLDKRI
jgi:hypothetical protein